MLICVDPMVLMLILLTKLMSAVIGKGKGVEQTKAAPVAAAPAAGISDRKAFDAAIAVAIATYMGNEPEGLRIHSIKRA
mgnify:CR=1 FL=1